MGNKHRRTLQAIFADPVSGTIRWDEIEALFKALGAEIKEGRGSRIRVRLNGFPWVFHRPHPRKETRKGAVEDVREFLTQAGVPHEE